MSETLQTTTPTVSIWRPAVVLFVLLTVVTGWLYPKLLTYGAQALFPREAQGGLIYQGEQAVGAQLIGQSFNDPAHFWGRLSATAPMPYNASASGGSNLGPTNPALIEAVKARIQALHDADPSHPNELIPVDLVTASASGLDPHISVAAAQYQLNRVAHARHIPTQDVQTLIQKHTEQALFGFLGEARVNVLELNLELDAIHP